MYQNFFFLKRHKRLQHDETPCKDCGSKFHGSNELSRHIRKEHLTGNEHICELCKYLPSLCFFFQFSNFIVGTNPNS